MISEEIRHHRLISRHIFWCFFSITFPASSTQDLRRTYSDLEIANNLFFLLHLRSAGTSGLKQRGQRGPTWQIRASFWETQPRPVHDRKQEAWSLWVSGTCAHVPHSDAAQMHSQGVCVCVYRDCFQRGDPDRSQKTGSVGDEAQCSKGFFLFFSSFFF